MKAVVVVKPSPREPRRLLAHCYREHGRGGDEVPSEDRVVEIVTNIDGYPTRAATVDCASLLSGHHGRGKWLRHVVLSAEDCTEPDPRADYLARLRRMVPEFVERFAPGATYLAVLHRDRCHPHVHLLVCNSVQGRTLDWQPAALREMQAMTWTTHAVSGRGGGRGRAIDAYPLSQNLDASTLANLNQEQLHELVRQGKIEIGRRTKSGDISSIIYHGRRIRLSTLERLSHDRRPPGTVADSGDAPKPVPRPGPRQRPVRRRPLRPLDAGRTPARRLQREVAPGGVVAPDRALEGLTGRELLAKFDRRDMADCTAEVVNHTPRDSGREFAPAIPMFSVACRTRYCPPFLGDHWHWVPTGPDRINARRRPRLMALLARHKMQVKIDEFFRPADQLGLANDEHAAFEEFRRLFRDRQQLLEELAQPVPSLSDRVQKLQQQADRPGSGASSTYHVKDIRLPGH